MLVKFLGKIAYGVINGSCKSVEIGNPTQNTRLFCVYTIIWLLLSLNCSVYGQISSLHVCFFHSRWLFFRHREKNWRTQSDFRIKFVIIRFLWLIESLLSALEQFLRKSREISNVVHSPKIVTAIRQNCSLCVQMIGRISSAVQTYVKWAIYTREKSKQALKVVSLLFAKKGSMKNSTMAHSVRCTFSERTDSS